MKKEKTLNIIIYILILATILSMILLNPLGNLDEIWNYNFARNIADGLIPYKDFNMLQMPLLPMIGGAFLKVLPNQLIIMRLLASILCSAILYMIYRIFSILNMKKETSIIFTFLIGYLFKDLFCIDYNFATLLVVLLITAIEIKSLENSNKNFLVGFLAGLCITLKQTSRSLYCNSLSRVQATICEKKRRFKTIFKIIFNKVSRCFVTCFSNVNLHCFEWCI